MSSIVGLVAVLAAILLIRSAFRLWNRRIEASLESHLRRARDFAARVRAEREAADRQMRSEALLVMHEAGGGGTEP